MEHMDNLEAFNLLGNGVITFKNKKIEHINQYMLEVLNIEFLSKKNGIDIFLKTINIENEENLFLFFCNYEYFKYIGKTIIISQKKYDNLDIFSFMLITHSLLGTIQNYEKEHVLDHKKVDTINIDSKVAKFYKVNEISQITVLTLYKGLPLKNLGKILRLSENSIEILVDHKHHISLLQSDDILLISNTKRGKFVVHGHVANTHENIFTINNFVLVKKDAHLRQSIRIKPTFKVIVEVTDTNYKVLEFTVHDLSEKGISIAISKEEEEEFLKNKTSMSITLYEDKLPIQTKYLKTIYNKDGQVIKIIFLIISINKSSKKIHEYLTKQQNNIINEVHNYATSNE